MSRREARRHAFALLFQMPFHKDYDAETLSEAYSDYFEGLEEGERLPDEDKPYLIKLVSGVLDRLPELDALIKKHLRDWRIERLNKVDLAVLRLGAYELLHEPEVPAGAAVNEAVELAKRYGADESYSFVNGVLGRISRERAGEQSGGKKTKEPEK